MKTALTFLFLAAPVLAVTDVKIGDHPTSRLTPYPSILSLHAHGGRLYMGYGTRDDFYPPVIIVSYDPALHAFRLEHSAASDEIATFRTIGDTLYAAHSDPSHFEDFRDYSYRGPDGIWRDAAPAGCFHVYDVASAGGNLFFCGSRDAVEGSSVGGIIMGSTDGGASWEIARSGFGDRLYWCYGLGSRLYFQNGALENGLLVPSGGAYGSTKTRTVSLHGQPLAIHMGNGVQSNGLSAFDGMAASTLHPYSHLFAWDNGTLYAVHPDYLTGTSRVHRAAWLSALGAVWEETPIEPGSNITSFAVLDGRAYFGASDGSLRAANLDGTPLSLPPATVQNDMSDSFGRGLAASGSLMACGAPDALSTRAAAGRVGIWEHNPATDAWSPAGTLTPPAPRLSGWFGKDVALQDDVLAVVETGYDLSGRDRGKDARVHVFQIAGGAWASRGILSLPYAHRAALLPDFLAVATANPSGSQTAGHPGVTPYRITRAWHGGITLTAQSQLKPVQNKWGYKPSTRVVMQGDLLVGAFAGDPSRQGGQGMVSIWRRAADGTSFLAAPEQEIAGAGPIHFGYAVALDGHWLAVGAPRDDAAAPQAGAVYLYKRPSLTQPFALTQTLLPPFPQNEAAFGSALAIRDGTLLAGAPGMTADGRKHRGAVYYFRRDADDAWRLSGEMPRPAASLAEFGVEVLITDNRLVAASRLSSNTVPEMERLSFVPFPPPASLYESWRAAHGLTGAETDSDVDGLSDLVEYALNLDPRIADAGGANHALPEPLFGLPRFSTTGTPPMPRLQWLQRTDDPRLTSMPEYSSDLVTWMTLPASAGEIEYAGTRFTVRSMNLPGPATGRGYVRQSVQYLSGE